MGVFHKVFANSALFVGIMVAVVPMAPAHAGQQSATFGASLHIATPARAAGNQSGQLKYTCRAASYVLLNAGYSDLVAISCSGDTYSFQARRLGTDVQLDVKAASGKISKIQK